MIPIVALRAVLLAATFAVAWRSMHDVGFTPGRNGSVTAASRASSRATLNGPSITSSIQSIIRCTPSGSNRMSGIPWPSASAFRSAA
jgi:hypothetical protein